MSCLATASISKKPFLPPLKPKLSKIPKITIKYEELFKFETIDDKILEKKSMSKTLLFKFISNGGKIFLKYKVDKFYRLKDYRTTKKPLFYSMN